MSGNNLILLLPFVGEGALGRMRGNNLILLLPFVGEGARRADEGAIRILPSLSLIDPMQTHTLTFSAARDLPPRHLDAHKGDFGHVLVVGGHAGMGGAVLLAAKAALKVGAGLVSVATQAAHVSAILSACPELMCHAVDIHHDLSACLNKASVMILGPGLGQDAWSQSLYAQVLMRDWPMVIDADGLNLLARSQTTSSAQAAEYRTNWILTPHVGEAARLLGVTTGDIQADRLSAAEKLQTRYGGVVVLKGAGTLVRTASHTGICTAGNPGMASGGMGDVLAGIIGGLLAQKYQQAQSAQMGVMIHALAADQAAKLLGERGLSASDVIAQLPMIVNGITR